MKRILGILSLLASPFLFTQELVLQWDLLSVPRLNGLLVHTAPDGTVVFVQGEKASSETLGRESFQLTSQTGRYQLFVINPDADGDFADWSSSTWQDYTEVVFSKGTLKLQLQPEPGAGAVWHALDLLGDGLQPVFINQILPRSNAVYGQVFDSATGLTLSNIRVEAQQNGTTIVRDVSNRRGLFLFFLPEGSYALHFLSERHQPLSLEVNNQNAVFPRHVDVSLGSGITENNNQLTLLWSNYPENLNLSVVETKQTGESSTLSAQQGNGLIKTLNVKTLSGSTYKIVVAPVSEDDALLFGYSQATVSIHGGEKPLRLTLPLGQEEAWEAAVWNENAGWVQP